MNIVLRSAAASFTVIAMLVIAGCGGGSDGVTPAAPPATTPAPGEVTSKLTPEQAVAVAQNALQGLNDGDFAVFSRDWSENLRATVKEPEFVTFREQALQINGKYLSLTRVELAVTQTPEIIRWTFTGTFEKGEGQFTLTFRQTGDKIEGVRLVPAAQAGPS